MLFSDFRVFRDTVLSWLSCYDELYENIQTSKTLEMLNLLYTKFKTLGKLILFYKGNTISNDYTSKIALEMKIGQKRIRMQMR